MIQTVNLNNFRDAFTNRGRGEQFSYEGLEVLFDYLESLEEGGGTPYELDVIAICCDFTEEAPLNIASKYNFDVGQFDDVDEEEYDEVIMQYVIEQLSENNMCLGESSDGLIVYQKY